MRLSGQSRIDSASPELSPGEPGQRDRDRKARHECGIHQINLTFKYLVHHHCTIPISQYPKLKRVLSRSFLLLCLNTTMTKVPMKAINSPTRNKLVATKRGVNQDQICRELTAAPSYRPIRALRQYSAFMWHVGLHV